MTNKKILWKKSPRPSGAVKKERGYEGPEMSLSFYSACTLAGGALHHPEHQACEIRSSILLLRECLWQPFQQP